MDAFRSNLPGQADSVRNREGFPRVAPGSNLRPLAAMAAGICLAFILSGIAGLDTAWGKRSLSSPARISSGKNSYVSSAAFSDLDLDHQTPQAQAEILLERAISRSDGDMPSDEVGPQIENQIESRIDAWRGKLQWDAQLGQLTTAAMNSNDRSLQNSAVEVQLAAYGLTKSQSTVESLIRQADPRTESSANHARQIWALWTLGLLANRGIETDRIVQVLSLHLKTPNPIAGRPDSHASSEDTRRWAVESLALIGTTPTIAPLLAAMHDDPSPTVRQRAACSLAESGMLSHEQRLMAVPQLINYLDDPALDPQTRGWALEALGDITGQRLPNNSSAWRHWYQNEATN